MKKGMAKKTAVVLLVLATSGCQPKCAADRGKHTWGKWKQDSEFMKLGLFGIDKVQKRICETCGLEERK